MAPREDLSLLLARRQKRLIYWREQFEGESLTAEQREKLGELFTTYRLLISKILRAESPLEREECEQRMESIETELTSLFEQRRLLTSSIGAPAIREDL